MKLDQEIVKWMRDKFQEYKESRPEGEKDKIEAIEYFMRWLFEEGK